MDHWSTPEQWLFGVSIAAVATVLGGAIIWSFKRLFTAIGRKNDRLKMVGDLQMAAANLMVNAPHYLDENPANRFPLVFPHTMAVNKERQEPWRT